MPSSESYTAEEAAKWHKNHGFKTVAIEGAAELKHKTHEAILQTLERSISGFILSKDSFMSSVSAWEGIPLIFAKEHPNLDAFSATPEAALKAVGGRWAGFVRNPRVIEAGHPRLMGELEMFEDDEMQRLYEAGKLSHSTAFKAAVKDGRTVGPIIPNHVLLFEETEVDLPKDPGTFILNKEGVNHSNNLEGTGLLQKAKAAESLAGQGKEGDTMEAKELEAKLQSFGVEYEAIKNKLEAKETEFKNMVAAKDKEIADLKAQVELVHKAEADRKWESVKANLPPGWLTKEEEPKTRGMAESDPIGFANKLASHYAGLQNAVVGAQGAEFVNKPKPKEGEEAEVKKRMDGMLIPAIDVQKR